VRTLRHARPRCRIPHFGPRHVAGTFSDHLRHPVPVAGPRFTEDSGRPAPGGMQKPLRRAGGESRGDVGERGAGPGCRLVGEQRPDVVVPGCPGRPQIGGLAREGCSRSSSGTRARSSRRVNRTGSRCGAPGAADSQGSAIPGGGRACRAGPGAGAAVGMTIPVTTLRWTGPTVTTLGLGCTALSGACGPGDDEEGVRTIHAALDGGIALLDTGGFLRFRAQRDRGIVRLRRPIPRGAPLSPS